MKDRTLRNTRIALLVLGFFGLGHLLARIVWSFTEGHDWQWQHADSCFDQATGFGNGYWVGVYMHVRAWPMATYTPWCQSATPALHWWTYHPGTLLTVVGTHLVGLAAAYSVAWLLYGLADVVCAVVTGESLAENRRLNLEDDDNECNDPDCTCACHDDGDDDDDESDDDPDPDPDPGKSIRQRFAVFNHNGSYMPANSPN